MPTCGFLVFNKREEEERCLQFEPRSKCDKSFKAPVKDVTKYKRQLYEVLKRVKPFPLQLNCLSLQMQN